MKKILSLLFCLGLSIISYATEINFSISVDKKKAVIGGAVQLNLAFKGTQDIPVPKIEDIEGFSVQYLGPSTQVSFVNGKVSSSVTYMYYLVPLKTGSFKVGPFAVNYKGETYTSNELSLEVVEGTPSQQRGGGGSDVSGKIDLNDKVFLVIQADKNKVYLNEKFDVSIKLYANSLSVRCNQYPQLNHEGISIAEYKDTNQYKETVGGVDYDVVEFQTEAFSTKNGQLAIGPAALNCEVLIKKEKSRSSFDDFDNFFDHSVFDNFFGGYNVQLLTLNAPQIPITAAALPENGKPQDFSGAVGDFDFDVDVSPKEVGAGDPVTLKLTVKGEGNFDTVTAPLLRFNENDFKVYEPQSNSKEGVKTFEYAVIPKNERVKEIPRITLSFFDTKKGEYRIIQRGPFEITVHKSEARESTIVEPPQKETQKIVKPQELGRDVIYIKDSPGKVFKRDYYIYKNKLFLLIQFLPLLVFVIIFRIHKHYSLLKTDTFYAKELKAPKIARRSLKELHSFMLGGNTARFYETMFKTLQKYLGFKLRMPWGGITTDIVNTLKSKRIDADILEKVSDLFSQCDMARYSPLEFDKEKMESSLEKLKLVIERLEKNKI